MPLGFEWQDVSKHDCKVQSGKFFMLEDEWMKLMKFEAVGKLHLSEVLGGIFGWYTGSIFGWCMGSI